MRKNEARSSLAPHNLFILDRPADFPTKEEANQKFMNAHSDGSLRESPLTKATQRQDEYSVRKRFQ